MTYRLKGRWALRGFTNDLFCAIDLAGEHENPVRPLPKSMFYILSKCDGQTELDRDKYVAALLRHDVIEPGAAPLSPGQRYRAYPFERRRFAQIGITGRCNYRCRHCFMAGDQHAAKPRGEFTAEECERILDELLSCGIAHIELTGGEPLLSDNFFTFAKGMAKRHMRLRRVLTNGSLITDEVLERLIAMGHAPEIVISFDSLTAHDWMRGVSGAGQAAIDALRRARKHGLDLRCAVNVNARTLGEFMDTCRFLKGEGVKSLYIILTSQTPRWNENAWNEETLTLDTYFTKAAELAQEAAAENWGVDIDVFNGFRLSREGEFTKTLRPLGGRADLTEPAMGCGRGTVSFFIAHDARVLPCDAFEGISLAGGIMQDDNNILTRPLADILADSSYSRMYDMPLSEVAENNPECAECAYLDACRGGCRAYAYGASMAFHEGYHEGKGRLNYYAQTSCAYYKGGYAE